MTSSNLLFAYDRLSEPYLRFYANLRYISPRDGLKRAGPYSAYRLNNINIGIVTENSTTNEAINLVKYLINGFDSYYTGLKNLFKANEINQSQDLIIQIDSKKDEWTSIENSYHQLAEKLPGDGVILFFLDDESVDKYYLKIKSLRFKYLPKTIRIQVIRKSTLLRLLKNPSAMRFSLMNLATAIYAKSGGTPWLHDGPIIPAGVFIGIAFTKPKIQQETTSTKELFYYGVLTVYNKFGKYLDTRVKSLTIEVPRTRKIKGTKGLYIPKEDMIELIREVISHYNPPIIIIHKSSRFHSEEKEAIQETLKEKDIDYVLTHVESSNPYRGFGEEEHGYNTIRGDLLLDQEIPNRAIFFTTGCTQSDKGIKLRKRPGTPRPLELEIEDNTSPFDTKEIASHILSLTKLDWNTTDIEVRTPVTIKYARRAAMLAPYMEGIVAEIRDLM